MLLQPKKTKYKKIQKGKLKKEEAEISYKSDFLDFNSSN